MKLMFDKAIIEYFDDSTFSRERLKRIPQKPREEGD